MRARRGLICLALLGTGLALTSAATRKSSTPVVELAAAAESDATSPSSSTAAPQDANTNEATSTTTTRPVPPVTVASAANPAPPAPSAELGSCGRRYAVAPRTVTRGELPPITFARGIGERSRCLLALETATGKELGAVYQARLGFVIDELSVSLDMSTVYVSEVGDGLRNGYCAHRVVGVDTRNGASTIFADGRHASLSSDGAYLAYVTNAVGVIPGYVDNRWRCANDAVVVRELASGDEWVYRGWGDPNMLRWSPDNHYLTLSVFGADTNHVSVLDLKDGSVSAARGGGLEAFVGDLPKSMYYSESVIGWSLEGRLVLAGQIIPYSSKAADWVEEYERDGNTWRLVNAYARDQRFGQIASSGRYRLDYRDGHLVVSDGETKLADLSACFPTWPAHLMFAGPPPAT